MLPQGVFDPLNELDTLGLSHNKLSNLSSVLWREKCYPVNMLDVSYNRLVYLDHKFWERAEKLHIFGISYNPWDCKCLSKIEKLMRERFIVGGVTSEVGRPICVVGHLNGCDDDSVKKSQLRWYYDHYPKPPIKRTIVELLDIAERSRKTHKYIQNFILTKRLEEPQLQTIH